MTVLTKTEQDLARRLKAAEEALRSKAVELEVHLEEKAKASRYWLCACAASLIAGIILAHIL